MCQRGQPPLETPPIKRAESKLLSALFIGLTFDIHKCYTFVYQKEVNFWEAQKWGVQQTIPKIKRCLFDWTMKATKFWKPIAKKSKYLKRKLLGVGSRS